MSTVLADVYPVARKAHGCNACLGRIAVGDQYHRQRVAGYEGAWTWKAHALCSVLVQMLGEDFGDGLEFDPDELATELRAVLSGLIPGVSS